MTWEASTQQVLCPRCGYDLRGAMIAWQTSCPLRGICTECGLEYNWIDVIDPNRLRPMWCVEYARNPRDFGRNVIKTAALQARPWRFWTFLRMQHQPRFSRIIIYLAILFLTLYPAVMANQARSAWKMYHSQYNVPSNIQPAQVPQPPISDWHAVAWSAALPLSDTSPGFYMFANAFYWPFPSPRSLLWESWWNDGLASRFWLQAVVWSSLLLLMPLTFALLPQTRRQAKVRWAHIFRIALYAIALTVPLLWWVAVLDVPRSGALTALLLCGINITWWGCACRDYLQLPRPWVVVSVLTAMLLIFACVILGYFMTDAVIRYLV